MTEENKLREALLSCNAALKQAYADKSLAEERCGGLLAQVFNLKMELREANERISLVLGDGPE